MSFSNKHVKLFQWIQPQHCTLTNVFQSLHILIVVMQNICLRLSTVCKSFTITNVAIIIQVIFFWQDILCISALHQITPIVLSRPQVLFKAVGQSGSMRTSPAECKQTCLSTGWEARHFERHRGLTTHPAST